MPDQATGPPVARCYLCRGTGDLVSRPLGSQLGSGSPVLVCADGTGCQDDGTVRHGPPWGSHPRAADCPRCSTLAARSRV